MQRLRYRPCVGRRVVRCQYQNVRFNSTDPSPSDFQPSSMVAEPLEKSGQPLPILSIQSIPKILGTSESSTSIPTVTSGKPSNSRIARSWGGIAIPSREDIARNPHSKQIVPAIDSSKDFRPNLGYLTKRTSTFASRLAQRLTAPQTQAEPPLTSPTAPRTPKSRIDPTIAARRLERLEREKKWAERTHPFSSGGNYGAGVRERPPPPSFPPNLRRGFQRFEGTDGPSQGFNRSFYSDRESQSDRRGQQPWRDGPEVGGRDGMRGGRGGMRAGGVMGGRGGMSRSGRRDTGGTSLSRARGRPPSSIRRTVGDEDQNDVRGEDVTYEILEAGGEPTEPAQLTNPDFSPVNLDDVLGPSPTSKLDLVVAPRKPDSDYSLLADPRAQRVLEYFGGQYSRFASQTSDDYIAGPQTLGPMKHAQLTLARRRDVNINQRLQAGDIVTSLVGGSSGSQDARTQCV